MSSRTMRTDVRRRLIILAVVSVLAVSYTGTKYAGLAEMVMPSTYSVSVELAESGGIFQDAEVTYLGVPIGRVGETRVTDTGVSAELKIGEDWEVPADVEAHVHNRSAVGEQYVDLVPRSDSSTFLAAGDVIVRDRTTTPLDESVLLADTDEFARSVPLDDLRTVVTEMGAAFSRTGPDLERILDGSDQLMAAATEHLPGTISLLESGETVMRTQNEQISDIRSFARDLAAFFGALSGSDRDLGKAIRDGSGFARQNRLLLEDTLQPVYDLVSQLMTLNTIGATHLPQIEQALVALPWAVSGTAAGGRHGRAVFVSASAVDPQVCRQGYIPPAEWRSTDDWSIAPVPWDIRCTETGTGQRGSQYAPGGVAVGTLTCDPRRLQCTRVH
jgi:phospholipid/cholesterol/gamma-HCH transport system substrate-binding protein